MQTKTEYVSDFYVDVKENGKTYKYILNNPSFTAYLKVVKKDVQTKKTVLKAGTTYQIFKVDENGKENHRKTDLTAMVIRLKL